MTFFEVDCRKNVLNVFCLKDKVTVAQEETMPNIWNAVFDP